MDGAAPAILSAIENATGVSFNHVPLMPEAMIDELSVHYEEAGASHPSKS
jgi:CO/xanthine dehydrogenase Mo-binding subunit